MKVFKRLLPVFLIAIFMLGACKPAPVTTPEVTDVPEIEETTEVVEPEVTEAPATEEVAEPVTLTIMHNWEPSTPGRNQVLAAIIEEFSAAHPNITVVQEIFPDTEVPNKVDTAYLAGEEPEIVFANQWANTRIWTDNGVTVPVQDYLVEWGMGDNYFIQSTLDSYTSDTGDLRAFPLSGFYWPIFYRTDIFEAAGVEIPTTQEELIAVAPALRAAGFQPFVVGGTDYTGLNFMMLQMQGCMDDKEGLELAANGGWAANANALKCAELFVQMRDGGVFADGTEGFDFTTMLAEFSAGNVAMMMAGSWSFVNVPVELHDKITVGGFPIPAESVQDKPVYYSSYNSKAVWITRNGAAKIDAVAEFIKYLYAPENMARLTEGGNISALVSEPVDKSVLNPLLVKCFDLVNIGKVLMQPQDAFPSTIKGETDRVVREAYIPNGMTAIQILEALDAEYN